MGARIESVDGHAPLTVHGAPLHGHRLRAGDAERAGQERRPARRPARRAGRRRSPSRRRRAITPSGRFAAFGLQRRGRRPDGVGRRRPARATAQTLAVPGDFSSAAFWMVAAAALPGSRVDIDDVGLNPTRTGLVDVLRRFGARVEVDETGDVGRRAARHDHRRSAIARGAVEIAPEEVPGADRRAAGDRRAGGARRRGQRSGAPAELRVKESDRIAALVAGFRALGIDADERPDGFVVRGSGGAGRRRRRRPRRSPDGDGVRDRGARRASGRRGSKARMRSRSPIRASSRRSPGWSLRPSVKDLKTTRSIWSDSWAPARRPSRARWPDGSAGEPSTSTS